MKIKTKFYISIVLVFSFGLISIAQGFAPIEAYGLNTVAGYSTVLRTSKTSPNSDVIFKIKKPGGDIVPIEAKTNQRGVAIADLSDYYTRRAGNYSVAVVQKNTGISSGWNSFDVYPGSVSSVESRMAPADQVIRSVNDRAYVDVTLRDNYKNPVPYHMVKLIPSLKSAIVSSGSNLTDANGSVGFEVNSKESGAVSFSAYDVTSDVLLEDTARVLFFASSGEVFGNRTKQASYYASVLAVGGPVDSLKFEQLPAVINPGDNVSVKITAYDSQNQIASDYTGKVKFSSSGSNAQFANIPDDYQFTVTDQGEHVFSLAFSFQQVGDYAIKVTDLSNSAIFGDQVFTVTPKSSADLTQNAGITISNPVTGTYSNNVQVIGGVAPPGSKLKIFDNDIEIASLIADINGNFSFTTGVLSSGEHQFYVARVNDVGTIVDTSDAVAVVIDTDPPEISSVLLEPSGSVDPASAVKVKLFTDDQLAKATLVLQGSVYEMSQTTQGVYEVAVAAPIGFGEYQLDFVLTDDLGNESSLKNQATLKVGKLSEQVGEIGNISNLVATPGDTRVTLEWSAPQNLATSIVNYRVYYGISPNQLTEAVDTLTNATTWYIPNLQNGVEYYFAVIPVDDKGTTPKSFSEIVATTPNPAVAVTPPPTLIFGADGQEALADLDKDVSESGPEMYGLVLLAVIGGIFYSGTRRRRLD